MLQPTTGLLVAADPEPVADAEAPGDSEGPQQFESLSELEKVDEIIESLASEISGVKLLRGKSGAIYLMSDKPKILPKKTQLGGYGTGSYIKLADPAQGVEFALPHGTQPWSNLTSPASSLSQPLSRHGACIRQLSR